jgi:hypothetical protein
LQLILKSPWFSSTRRGKQFLTYVVQYRLKNPSEPLKERTIGMALFNRPADYATGDDSVVRAQAREVRRRLEQYYQSSPQESLIRIILPVGSYAPEFHWTTKPTREENASESSVFALQSNEVLSPVSQRADNQGLLGRLRKSPNIYIAVIAAIIVLAGTLLLWRANYGKPAQSAILQFWAPAINSPKPLLICLPKPIFFRPSKELYQKSAKFPGEFDREVYRMTHRPHLNPEDKVSWGDMVEYADFGVGKGDVQAAIELSSFFGYQKKLSEVRIGGDYSFEDLRKSPAVVIGAFSNPWTMEMTSGLHFIFADDQQGLHIEEQGPSGRSWSPRLGSGWPIKEDYGLISRVMDSRTGQFVVFVAGLTGSGSDAAADLIVNPEKMEKALHGLSKDWAQKNVQIVISTTVTDFVPGPAKVVAVYVW